jgi:drug/metabolite transporter (DMT)-like permease
MSNPIVIAVLAMFSCILWGSAYPAIKIGYSVLSISAMDTFSQIVFAGSRFTIAGILTILFGSLAERKILYPKRKVIPKIIKISLFQTILQYVCFYIGVANATGVKSAIVSSLNVFLSILVATLFFRLEKLTSKKILGGLLGCVGVALVNLGGKSLGGGNFSWIGEGMVLASVMAYAISTNLIKIYNQQENPALISGYQFVWGGLVMILVGVVLGGRIDYLRKGALLILLYLGALSAIAYTLWAFLLKFNPVSKISVYGFMTPLCGVVLSGIFLGEMEYFLNLTTIAALILVCFSIILLNRK